MARLRCHPLPLMRRYCPGCDDLATQRGSVVASSAETRKDGADANVSSMKVASRDSREAGMTRAEMLEVPRQVRPDLTLTGKSPIQIQLHLTHHIE